MALSAHEIIGAFVLLILIFLLLNNGPQTVAVIKAIGSTTTSLTTALQGRDTSGFQPIGNMV